MSDQVGKINPKLKLALEFGPVLLFFVGFKFFKDKTYHIGNTDYSGFVVMTAIFVVLIAASTALLWKLTGKLSKMQLMTLILVVVMGGATVWFHNETFIKWKPSVLYWAMALSFWISQVVFRKNLLHTLMGGQLDLPAPVWRTLTRAWIGFFSLMGFLNLYVAYSFSTEAWVNFKLFGSLGLMLIFTLAQGVYLSRHLKPAGGGAAETGPGSP